MFKNNNNQKTIITILTPPTTQKITTIITSLFCHQQEDLIGPYISLSLSKDIFTFNNMKKNQQQKKTSQQCITFFTYEFYIKFNYIV